MSSDHQPPTDARIADALRSLCDRLVTQLRPDGFWEGMLSSSALSTATAVSAMALSNTGRDRLDADIARIRNGVAWIAEHQNADGGWGDTIDSPSNLATTLLAASALRLAAPLDIVAPAKVVEQANQYLTHQTAVWRDAIDAVPSGDITAKSDLARAIQAAYGADRTFAVPILMNCALAGLVPWRDVPRLPFELAIAPHGWYKLLRLHVVSYALPALIAIGLSIEHHRPTGFGLRRAIRRWVRPRVLAKLANIQPSHGGFLDAAPLTSFVAMGLVPVFGREQPVAARCLDFLRQSQREDGSWPIDTNLSVWVTSSAVAALDAAGSFVPSDYEQSHRCRIIDWITERQYGDVHPFTNAAPGGWGWTHLPGGVPDGDDTSGAILVLNSPSRKERVAAGVQWLLQLQNRDGGWPTFCRGWGKLPFDQSSPDITAHAIRAIHSADPTGWNPVWQEAIRRGRRYLGRVQQSDGSWVPLWFGNQSAPGQNNPVLGTALVLRALEIVDDDGQQGARGVKYLCGAQNADGGWGGADGVASSIEETALAVSALAGWREVPAADASMAQGVEYLLQASGRPTLDPAPIGLYFARLWYSEQLYPLIWTVEALGRAASR